MERLTKITTIGRNTIFFTFILLFVYTGIMKIRDYEIFRIRLDQSPMLEGFGDLLAILIPAALLISALLLLTERTRKAGMYSALGLMILFTGYIALVLGFFPASLPCSCNGVLESMTWTQHLWFNIGFLVLAGIGVVLNRIDSKNQKKMNYEALIGT